MTVGVSGTKDSLSGTKDSRERLAGRDDMATSASDSPVRIRGLQTLANDAGRASGNGEVIEEPAATSEKSGAIFQWKCGSRGMDG